MEKKIGAEKALVEFTSIGSHNQHLRSFLLKNVPEPQHTLLSTYANGCIFLSLKLSVLLNFLLHFESLYNGWLKEMQHIKDELLFLLPKSSVF
jgi:hypothetical protein